MKKLLIVLLCLIPITIYAGTSRTRAYRDSWPDSRILITAEGDTIAAITISKEDYKPGSYIYSINTYPTSPDAVYDVAIANSRGGVACDATSRSTTADEFFDCKDTTGKYEKLYGDLTVTVDDLGAGSTIIEIDIIAPRE